MGVPIQGQCDAKFEAVKAAFETNFREFNEIGASVAITLDGEFVVDLWGGHLDSARTDPWQEDTLVNVWSSTKTMAANQLRLWFASFAYTLICALRRLGLQHTALANATRSTSTTSPPMAPSMSSWRRSWRQRANSSVPSSMGKRSGTPGSHRVTSFPNCSG